MEKEITAIQIRKNGNFLVDAENVLCQGLEPIRILSETIFFDSQKNLTDKERFKLGYLLHDTIVDFEKHLMSLINQNSADDGHKYTMASLRGKTKSES